MFGEVIAAKPDTKYKGSDHYPELTFEKYNCLCVEFRLDWVYYGDLTQTLRNIKTFFLATVNGFWQVIKALGCFSECWVLSPNTAKLPPLDCHHLSSRDAHDCS